jgi:hypothetical protein
MSESPIENSSTLASLRELLALTLMNMNKRIALKNV